MFLSITNQVKLWLLDFIQLKIQCFSRIKHKSILVDIFLSLLYRLWKIFLLLLYDRICLLRVSWVILHWLLCLLIYYHQFSSFVFSIFHIWRKKIYVISYPLLSFFKLNNVYSKGMNIKILIRFFALFFAFWDFFLSNSRKRSFSDSFDNSKNRHLKC